MVLRHACTYVLPTEDCNSRSSIKNYYKKPIGNQSLYTFSSVSRHHLLTQCGPAAHKQTLVHLALDMKPIEHLRRSSGTGNGTAIAVSGISTRVRQSSGA